MTMTTTRLSADDKADLIIDALTKGGPASQVALLHATGLTYGQFVAGWQHVKVNRAASLGLIPAYDPLTDTYGLWDNSEEAWRAASNRLEDMLTRYGVLDLSMVQNMDALGMMTPRWRRIMEMALDEYSEQVEHFRRVRVAVVADLDD